MPCYAPNKIKYSKAEIAFMKEYYGKLPNTQILKQLNTMRELPIKMSSLRHQLIRLKLIKGIRLIHWTAEQAQFLLDNYQTHGNIEIARELNKMKLNKRKFTKKNVWKKMLLLGIKRTDEQLIIIKENHVKAGHYPGRVLKAPQGTIKTNIINGIPYPHIKKGKFFVKLVREQWKETVGPIPRGMMVHFKDLNTMNIDPSNLELKRVGDLTSEQRIKMLRIAKANIEKLNAPAPVIPVVPGRADISDHSKKIKVVINSRLTLYVRPGTDIEKLREKYMPKPLFPKDQMERKLGYTINFKP